MAAACCNAPVGKKNTSNLKSTSSPALPAPNLTPAPPYPVAQSLLTVLLGLLFHPDRSGRPFLPRRPRRRGTVATNHPDHNSTKPPRPSLLSLPLLSALCVKSPLPSAQK